MRDFLTYFLSHMPSHQEWIAFLLVNIVAYVAARNTVLRRERQADKKAYAQQLERLETERSRYRQSQQKQQLLVDQQWAMIQQQAQQIQDLTHQLKAVKQLHLN